MSDSSATRGGGYWQRRAGTFRNSFWKRYKKLRGFVTGASADSTADNLHARYTTELFWASQLKPTLKTGYIPRTAQRLDAGKLGVKAIAFYLPQYHPIPENDAWWGRGFTEWNNVSRAVPQFIGHYQPRLPGDFGFYDLRLPQIMRQQIELAKDYGIHGFCFHHYWFNGRRLLELPVNNLLADPSLDIPFCLCWANENWSRRWDGSEHEILMPQKHTPEDDLAFIDDLIPAFRDSRYIRVDDKPLLIVYRPTLFPDIAATATRWRQRVKEQGLPGLYLVLARSLDALNPADCGFDAAVEFPPNGCNAVNITYQQSVINGDFVGGVYDYAELAARMGRVDPADFVLHKTVMPSWDNCARKLSAASSFVSDTPELYARWLDDAMAVTLRRPPSQRLLFINAWNEWAEGTYLEPDRRFGYANISATANVLARTWSDPTCDAFVAAHNATFVRRGESAVILHLYYEDLLGELCERYLDAAGAVDVFITVRLDAPLALLQAVAARLPRAYIIRAENRGRDFYPFLLAYAEVAARGYAFACKLHTKKSRHRVDGDRWRDQLMVCLLGGQGVQAAEKMFRDDPALGVIAPENALRDLAEKELNVGNREWLNDLLTRLGESKQVGKYDFEFPAGSMFWFRVEALRPLLDLNLTVDDFEHETGQLDGTLAHTLERLVVLFAARQQLTAREANFSARA